MLSEIIHKKKKGDEGAEMSLLKQQLLKHFQSLHFSTFSDLTL